MSRLAYLLVILVFLLDKIIQNTNYSPNWVSNYLDDFLLIPIFLGTALIVQQRIVFKGFSFKNVQILAVWLVFSMLYEFVIPKFTSNFISDLWDILAYGLGAIYFAIFINYPVVNSNS